MSSTVHHGSLLLSILIPTKDRYETLIPVVSEIVKTIRDPRLEIVICDNSTSRNAAVDSLIGIDQRIVYHHFKGDISIVDNTQRAIELCSGRYLCFIGDDDLVSPHIVSVTDWLETRSEDCLIYQPAFYWWRSVRFAKDGRYLRPGAFWLPKRRGGAVRPLRAATELQRVLARGGVAYMDLPRLYHGIVSRRAVERIKDRFGQFVPGSSPDMALCASLALTNDSYLFIDHPLTVFGAARNSGGGRTAARKHYGRIEEQKHLPSNIMDNWDEFLPRVWSEQIIYPQTIHEVMSRGGFSQIVSYPALYGSLIAYEPYILPHLWPALRRYLAVNPAQSIELLIMTLQKMAGRVRTEIRNATGFGLAYDVSVERDISAVMTVLGRLNSPVRVAGKSAA